MATVHYGRLVAETGFTRTVAIKRMRSELARSPEIGKMLTDEARLAARIQHPNVVSILDVVSEDGELSLVLEYVHGESLGALLAAAKERGERAPVPIASAIVAQALRGLHAAHEAKDDQGVPLDLVHRDLSPNNVLVDDNGVARLLDFGVAKARGRAQITEVGGLKGTVGYMAPEQVHGNATRVSDVFAMGVVLWEAIVGERLFTGESKGEALAGILMTKIPKPSTRGVDLPPALESAILKSLERAPEKRFATAREMAEAIEASVAVASVVDVGRWVESLAGPDLARRRDEIAAIEKAETTPTPETAPASPSSTATDSHSPPRRAIFAAIAVASIAIVVVAVTFGTRDRRDASASPSASGAPESLAAMTSSVEAVAPADPLPVAAPSSTHAPRAHAPGPVPSTASAPKRDCTVPYTVDESGRKTWKRECFSTR
jgi:serine/threonine-protein kinase